MNSTYNFERMTVQNSAGDIWKLKFAVIAKKLYRIGNNKFFELSPTITEAYLDYQIEKILLKKYTKEQ